MFTVSGYLGGVSYSAMIGGPQSELGQSAGCVNAGTPNVIDLLRALDGQPWQATPTGPNGTLDLTDPESVLGAVMGHTTVTDVAGAAPDILGPVLSGADY